MLFRGGLVETAKDGVTVLLPRSEITALTEKCTRSWGMWPFRVWRDERPANPALAWLRKVAVKLVDSGAPRAEGNTTVPEGERRSDTGQIRWHSDAPTGAWFGLDTPSAKALIGHVGGQRFEIGGVTFDVVQRPWPKKGPAYACISLVALDKKPLTESRKMLLAASARTENQNMAWNDDRTGLEKNGWGKGPTVSEAVPVSVTLPGAPFDVHVLNANGMPVTVKAKGTNSAAITADDKTLWLLLTRP